MYKKFISIVRGYHKQIFSFEKEENYHMMPLAVMQEEGYSCELFVINSQVDVTQDPNFIPGTKVIYYKNILHYLKYLWFNRKNIIYSNTLTIKSLIVGLIGKKTVFMAHDQVWPIKNKFFKRLIVNFFYRFFNFIRVINTGEAAFLKFKGIKSKVLPLAVSSKFYNNHFEEKKDIIFIGNIYPDKNPDFLISTMNILKQQYSNIKLYIVGEDRYNIKGKTFSDVISDNGLQKHIILLGFIPHIELGKLLKTKKIFVNTSISEGQCLAAYEATLSGCFCCLQNILAFPSVFLDNAFYHDTPSQLARNITIIYDNYPSYVTKIKNMQKIILEQYNYNYLKQKTKEMFLSLS